MDRQEIRNRIIDALKFTLEYYKGKWWYERRDWSDDDFYGAEIPIKYLEEEDYENLEDDIFGFDTLKNLDWFDFDEVYEEVFWDFADGVIKGY